MKRPKCLVIGAAGFIGSHLARRLVSDGADVHAMVRPGTPIDRLGALGDALTLHRLDLRDRPALEDCIAQVSPERVFHLAAKTRDGEASDPVAVGRSLTDYCEPLMHLLALLAQAPRPPRSFVRAGSIAEYGDAPLPYREDERESPVTPHGVRMLTATHLCAMLQKSLPFPVHTARLALTYGEAQSDSFLIPALADACRNNRPFVIQRPDDRRDLIHVADVVEALARLGETTQREGMTLNIATQNAPTMRDVAEIIVSLTGCDRDLVTFADPVPGSPSSVLLASAERARRDLGWAPAIDLERGLRMMLGTASDRKEERLRHA